MQLFILKPSKTQKILVVFLYITVAIILLSLPLAPEIKFALILCLSMLLTYELLRINLKLKKSILAIRLQNECWQIKLRNSWVEGKLIKQVFISDMLLLLVFKAKRLKYYSAINKDMLDSKIFRKLRVSTKISANNKE